MIRDYELVSPSLEGVIQHGSLSYEGLVRPTEILRVLDGPASHGRLSTHKPAVAATSEDKKVLEQYFFDLYGIFMKKLSHFAVNTEVVADEPVKMMAMLQEMFKVKRLMARGTTIE